MLSLLQASLLIGFENCKWMQQSRIWSGLSPCYLNDSINLKAANASLDNSVVNVLDLYLSSKINGVCTYSLLELNSSGSIQNGGFYVNVSLNIDADCTLVKVSLFDSVQGKLKNISVAGFVNLTTINSPELNLSQFVGHSLVKDYSDANLSLYLKYFKNGAQIAQNSVLTNFDKLDIPFSNTPMALVESPQWGFVRNGTTYTLTSMVYASILSQAGQFQKYYTFPAVLLYANNYDTMDAFYVDFSASGSETLDAASVAQRVYYKAGVVMAYFPSLNPVYCYQQRYDVISHACVAQCGDSQVEFNGMCVSICPQGHLSFNKICYLSCPAEQGAVKETSSACKLCSQKATDDGECVETSPANYFSYQNGFFSVCPEGTQPQDAQCVKIVSCTSPKLSFTKNEVMTCVDSCPSGYVQQRSECVFNCDSPNIKVQQGGCQATAPENGTLFDLDPIHQSNTACPGSTYNDAGNCKPSCSVGSILLKSLKTCYACTTDCLSMCSFYQLDSQDAKECIDTCDAPKFFINEGQISQCVTQCPNSGLYYKGQCQSALFDLCCGDPTCTSHKVKVGSECLDTCSGFITSSSNYSCQQTSCSYDYYYIDSDKNKVCTTSLNCTAYIIDNQLHNCFVTCPTGYFQHGQECKIDACQKYLQLPNVCVENCTGSKPYVQDKTCSDLCLSKTFQMDGDQKLCVDASNCTFYQNDTSSDHNKCIPTCNQVSHADLKWCVDSCPFYIQVSDKKVCYDSCFQTLTHKYTLGTQCFETCPQATSFIVESASQYLCNATCNSTFFSVISDQKFCNASCPSFFVKSGDLFQCQDSCPVYVDGLQCVDACVNFVSQNKCVLSCGGSYPYVASSSNNTCVGSCPNVFYSLGGTSSTSKICQDACNQFWSYDSLLQKLCKPLCDPTEFLNRQVSSESSECIPTCTNFVLKNTTQVCLSSCSAYFAESQVSKNCLAQCPKVFVTIGQQKTCFELCPSELPIAQTNGECQNSCATGLVNEIVMCVESCPTVKIPIVINSNGYKQCAVSCPSDLPYVQDSVCVAACNAGFGLEEKVCTKCPDNYPVENKKCVQTCSKVLYDGVCLSTCPPTLFNNSNVCVEECPKYFISDSKQCSETCTPKANSKECDNPCGTGYKHVSTDQCVTVCNAPFFVSGYLCLSACDQLVSVVGTQQFCVQTCPNYVKDGRFCTDSLPSDMYYTQNTTGKFIVSCPNPLLKNNASRQCLDQCAAAQFNDSFYCVDQCSPTNAFFVGQMCVSACPKFAMQSNQCVDSCVSTYFQVIGSNKVCQVSCKRYFPAGTQFECVDECNSTASFVDLTTSICATSCPNFYKALGNENICEASCGTSYVIQSLSKCVDSCGSLFINGQFCVPSCIQLGFYVNEQLMCVQTCVNFRKMVGAEQMCTDQCPNDKKYLQSQTNKLCVNCSMWQYDAANDKICTEACDAGKIVVQPDQTKQCVVNPCADPDNSFFDPASPDNKCVSKCPTDSYVIDGYRCNATCSMFIQGDSCIEACDYFTSENGNKVCAAKCPKWIQKDIGRLCASCEITTVEGECKSSCRGSGLYLNASVCYELQSCVFISTNTTDDYCLSSCASGFISGQTCLEYCHGTYWLEASGLKTCRACTASEFLDVENQCVSKCPDSRPYYNQTCVQNCYFAIKDVNSFNCTETCPSGYYIVEGYKNLCVDKCTDAQVAINQDYGVLCQDGCGALFYDPDRFQCSISCKYYVENKRECVSSCKQYYLNTTNITCVDQCPASLPPVGKQCSVPSNKFSASSATLIIIIVVSVVAVLIIATLSFYYIRRLYKANLLRKKVKLQQTGVNYYSKRLQIEARKKRVPNQGGKIERAETLTGLPKTRGLGKQTTMPAGRKSYM
ncbi:Conserved_hypothetical protein [Hexamita inflata]|uniref:Uncharacterized protein n=1 Tax=Hexamita inflata TaxID=28002 RepID=A0AA86RC75_9EUKA|nr:Conserved hypothetical protein [Hexamita inflata]